MPDTTPEFASSSFNLQLEQTYINCGNHVASIIGRAQGQIFTKRRSTVAVSAIFIRRLFCPEIPKIKPNSLRLHSTGTARLLRNNFIERE